MWSQSIRFKKVEIEVHQWKIKELGWKPVAAAGAVLGLLAGILGVANVGAGALIVGILAAAVTFGGLFIVCGDSAGGNGGKEINIRNYL